MSIPFEIIRLLMVLEMVVFVFLILPLPTHIRKSILTWLAQSHPPSWLKRAGQIVFVLLIILFADACNRTLKMSYYQSHCEEDKKLIKEFTMESSQWQAKTFYAQRNMYLTGFTLFLLLILKSFVRSLIDIAQAEEKINAVQKQAANQLKEYLKMLEESEAKDRTIADQDKTIEEFKSKMKSTEVILKQVKNQQDEYIRLSDRYNDMEKKLKRDIEAKKDI